MGTVRVIVADSMRADLYDLPEPRAALQAIGTIANEASGKHERDFGRAAPGRRMGSAGGAPAPRCSRAIPTRNCGRPVRAPACAGGGDPGARAGRGRRRAGRGAEIPGGGEVAPVEGRCGAGHRRGAPRSRRRAEARPARPGPQGRAAAQAALGTGLAQFAASARRPSAARPSRHITNGRASSGTSRKAEIRSLCAM